MRRICALFIAMVIGCSVIAYAADTNIDTDTSEPTPTEAVTEKPTEEPDIEINPDTGEPEVEHKGTILEMGKDYVLSYRNNVEVGTATVVISFIGNYEGMREQTFNIIPKPTAKPSSGGGGGGGSRKSVYSSATAQPTEEPDYTYHEAYVNGYESVYGLIFKPDSYITRAEAAAMLSRVLTFNEDTEKTIVFYDVKESDWFYDDVTVMSKSGVIKGYEGNIFKPNNQITRAELVTMLVRGSEETYAGVPFNDVSSDKWYADYIYTAYKLKYVDGYTDGKFRPDKYITRAEAVKIINGILDRNDYINETNPFKDLSETHWAYKEILEAAVQHRIESEE